MILCIAIVVKVIEELFLRMGAQHAFPPSLLGGGLSNILRGMYRTDMISCGDFQATDSRDVSSVN